MNGYFRSVRSAFLIALQCLATNSFILRLPCLTYAKFDITKPNQTLTGYVLETYSNLNADECESKCTQHRSCKSINTRIAIGENCQLNSKSTDDPFDNVNLSENVGWTHKTTNFKAINIGYVCEEKSPCGCGRTCIDSCAQPGFECQTTLIAPFHDCQDAYKRGCKESSVLPLYVLGGFMDVRCDMRTDGGGWIVFQRRINASVDFYRGWSDYKNGFGDLNGNFWLGLEKIHKLASPGRGAILRVDMKHFTAPNQVKYAEYTNFEISSESEGYKMTFGSYSDASSAGDSLSEHKGRNFSTFDHDQDVHETLNCASEFKGAWWYNHCFRSNLNGLYPTNNNVGTKCITWYELKNSYGGIIFSEMKIRYNEL